MYPEYLLEQLTEKHDLEALEKVYGDLPEDIVPQRDRLVELLEHFAETFGEDTPLKVFRAPGRVNLIGEHTDYNGLPVLPIALNRDIFCAASKRNDGQIVVVNVDPSFLEFQFPVGSPPKAFETGHWGNYVKAAMQGLWDEGKDFGVEAQRHPGANLLFSGNVPSAAGLSSSSALVVVSALALLGTCDGEIAKPDLAQVLSRAEHFVGTQGGGMDQTISLLGERDRALKIDFNPFGYSSVPVPPEVRIVVSNSMVFAAKTGGARYAYNRRVIECRIATALLNNAVKQNMGGRFRLRLLGDFTSALVGIPNKDLDQLAEKVIPRNAIRTADIVQHLGIIEGDFRESICKLQTGEILEEPEDGFHVWKRYRHVVTEGRRVEESLEWLSNGDVESFGKAMNESHSSCRDDYEISCEALDVLVQAALDAGALGSRLTGAGFGGCAVSLVRSEKVKSFMNSLRQSYYDGYLAEKHPDTRSAIHDLDLVLFPVRPAQGAGQIL